MKGAERQVIKQLGKSYTVRNASGGGGRDVPNYSDDGSLTGVLEQRSRPMTQTLSSGETVETDLEVRSVDPTPSIVGQGETDYPTKLVHPNGRTFEVVDTFDEDGGVTVITVVSD